MQKLQFNLMVTIIINIVIKSTFEHKPPLFESNSLNYKHLSNQFLETLGKLSCHCVSSLPLLHLSVLGLHSLPLQLSFSVTPIINRSILIFVTLSFNSLLFAVIASRHLTSSLVVHIDQTLFSSY